MKLSVTQKGGFLGIDQRIEIEDGTLTLTEFGKVTKRLSVAKERQKRLEDVARDFAKCGSAPPAPDGPASDSMETEICIVDGATEHASSFVSGQSMPGEAEELLALTGEILAESS